MIVSDGIIFLVLLNFCTQLNFFLLPCNTRQVPGLALLLASVINTNQLIYVFLLLWLFFISFSCSVISFLIKKGKNIKISPLAIYVFENVQGSSGAKFDTMKLGDRFKD